MATFLADGEDKVVQPEGLETIETVSSIDGFRQSAYWWAPSDPKPIPLLVHLHTWSYGYEMSDPRSPKGAMANGWAVICPNCRGPNNTPDACASEKAIQDVLDAVRDAKKRHAIDEERIYLIGASGGGHLALMMAALKPSLWAAVSLWCPVADIARWHGEGLVCGNGYPAMLEAVCGGTPAERPDEYRRRTPLSFLDAAREAALPIDIAAGIHDGHAGAVPVGHAIRTFNALADAADAISEADIAEIERTEAVPAHLAAGATEEPWYGERHGRIYLRRQSAATRLTLFEGAHDCCTPAALAWLGEQRRGSRAVWEMPPHLVVSTVSNENSAITK